MSEIIILGEERMVDVNIIDRAFTQPDTSVAFHWYLHTDHVDYLPYLISASVITNDVLTFRGVDIRSPAGSFGPKFEDDLENYSVTLGQLKHVYRERPSTLNGIEPGGSRRFAILFLSDEYRFENDPQGRLSAARGGPKWPVGAGSTIVALRAELAKAKADHAEILEKIKSQLLQNSVDQQATIEALFNKFLP